MSQKLLQIDIEITNRCNANCSFCPRDQTPHQGLMDPETFAKTLERVVEFHDLGRERFDPDIEILVSLCGLGEPLLHPQVADFVRQVRELGYFCSISSNGGLLTEAKGRALLDAGLSRIDLNVGEIGEKYEEVYQLKFEKTRERILRFNEMAGDDCEVRIILVMYEGGLKHAMRIGQYWRRQGMHKFFTFDENALTNRGGTLDFDLIQFDDPVHRRKALDAFTPGAPVPMCIVPFLSLFIGYDGQYYLCCSDWTKQTPMGTVHERSFRDVIAPKLEYVSSREPVCSKCNFDSTNHVANLMRRVEAGEMEAEARDEVIKRMLDSDMAIRQMAAVLGIEVPDGPDRESLVEDRKPVRLPIVGAEVGSQG